MSTDDWTCPTAWKDYLLKGYPSRRRPQRTHLRHNYWALHSARRDTGGRFNDLEGGKPAMNRRFLQDLDQGMADEMHQREAQPLPSWRDVQAAMDAVRAKRPDLIEVLEYFQEPPWLRAVEVPALARRLEVSEREVYRLRKRAVIAVWLQLRGDTGEAWLEDAEAAS